MNSTLLQLHTQTRELLLGSGRGQLALVLDAFYVNHVWDVWLTFGELATFIDVGKHTLRETLNEYSIFRKRKRTGGRGRPPTEFYVPAPADANHQFFPQLNPRAGTDLLEPGDVMSLASYRRALHLKMIEREYERTGGEVVMSRELQARRLGVTKQTVRQIDREVGIAVRARFKREKLEQMALWSLPRQSIAPAGTFLEAYDPDTQLTHRLPVVRAVALKAARSGCYVSMCRQTSNGYTPPPRPKAVPGGVWELPF